MSIVNKTICLNMIVKDESHVIEKTLTNLCDNIPFSYWVISDTGSTDNTRELITSFFKNKGIPGELVEHKWKDFSTNRNNALKCAFDKTDYLFIFDADDHIYGNFQLPNELSDAGYNLKFGKNGCVYERTLLVNNRIPWEYVGVLHEVIICKKENQTISLLDGDYYIESGRLGSRNNDPNKYKKDAKILEDAFYEADKNNEDIRIRYSFYCAQSYKDSGEDKKAIEWYQRRADYGGWDQEIYFSYYMIGDAYNRLGEKEKAIYYWIKAYQFDPQRLETMYQVIHHYYETKEWKIAFNYFKLVEPHLNDDVQLHRKLFVWKEVFSYHFDFDATIVAYNNEAWSEGVDAFKRLWNLRDNVDDGIIGNIIFNFQFFIPHMSTDIAEKNTVYVSDDFFSDFIEFINFHVITNNYKISEKDYNIIEKFIELMKPQITKYDSAKILELKRDTINPHSIKLNTDGKNEKDMEPIVFLSFTTCKRLDLFEKTVNSLLLYCKDIDLVNYFFCVDDNSSFEDREKMRTMYPFMNFYFKSIEEKGHRPSMNIIWNKINKLEPVYWIHMEDDWLFIKKDNYVTRSISYLNSDISTSKGIKQVLFNRNYGETIRSFDLVGGQRCMDDKENQLLLHIKDEEGLTGQNCSYWPHYSFRPSVTLVPTIMELGDFNTENSFFERDYADKYYERGYRSMFFNEINCIHIGKLTSETNDDKKNAYALNDVNQGLEGNTISKAKIETSKKTNRINKRIAFHCTQLCERGDAVALHDYAYYNREILNNESVIFYKVNKINKECVITKFKREFICVTYETNQQLEDLVQQYDVDYMYNICWGNPNEDYNQISCPILWHAIFTNAPFSRNNKPPGFDRYAVISRYLTDKYSCNKSFVPHMINMPKCEPSDNLRKKYGIPKDAFVLGRYGGSDSFDIGYVHQAIREILQEHSDIYFIFANTNVFYSHPKIIYMDTLIEQIDKARFIQTCDMMIHGRTVGETFGIAIGEFSFYNKPVMTNFSVPIGNLLSDNCHVEILGKKGFIYKSCDEVKSIIQKMYINGIDKTKNWKAYDDYCPERVMLQFKKELLSGFDGESNDDTVPEVVDAKTQVYIINLEKRTDRRDEIKETFIKKYEKDLKIDFFKACDGKELEVTDEITKLFAGNDFNNRSCIIGCALSHYNIWKKLVNDKNNDFYIVLEDDFECPNNVFTHLETIKNDMQEKEIVFLGYHMFSWSRKNLKDIYGLNKEQEVKNVTVTGLNNDLYLGATHAYSINKSGAFKLLKHIEENGIKNGIDYLMGKLIPDICYETNPHLFFAPWAETDLKVDSDIQYNFHELELPVFLNKDDEQYNYQTQIINLRRRPDRQQKIKNLLRNNEIDFLNYYFYKAVDGLDLEESDERIKIFMDNDFGYRVSIIGCALSHYNLWKKLIESDKDFYLVMEDDVNGCETNFNEKLQGLTKTYQENIDNFDFMFLGYSMYETHRKENYERYNADKSEISVHQLNRNFYIGGFFSYFISKNGAKKMVDYIDKNGIKHGIDYLVKVVEGLNCYECQPQIVFTNWNETFEKIDSDIQYEYKSILIQNKFDDYKFFEEFDLLECDVNNIKIHDLSNERELQCCKVRSETYDDCIGFNTFGYLKNEYTKLKRSQFVKKPNGIYLNMSRLRKKFNITKERTRVKLMCNWTTSEELCKEWQHMLPSSEISMTYNDIEFTGNDIDIDFYVIINKPREDEYFEANRTIVFQMEPWCGEEYQTWGVKTWGEWSKPDVTEFLQVRTHENFINNAFWQLTATYDELKFKTPRKTMGTTLSSICSSKYVDPGQKKRIDFIKFIEDKIDIHVYNQDNQFEFKNWKGVVTPHVDKDKGIMPYKYYFMVENNCENNFITEKIWEPLLTESLCFYDGCPNIKEYIDERAFVQINMDDFEGSLKIIQTAISEDWWSQRIEYIRNEKDRVLDYYGFFPTVERILKHDFNMKMHPTDDDIKYAKYFKYKPEKILLSTKKNKTNTIFDVIENVNQSIQCESGTDKNTTHSYLHIYEKYLKSYRKKKNKILEIGVMGGHSIVLWNNYLPYSKIIGMDINYSHLAVNFDNNKNVELLTMDGTDPETPKKLNTYFDIILDDASHFQHHQIQTLDIFLPYVKKGGIYIIEDINPANNQEGRLRDIATKHNYSMIWHDLRDFTPVRRFDNVIAAFIKDD